jgi:hypothetical protein
MRKILQGFFTEVLCLVLLWAILLAANYFVFTSTSTRSQPTSGFFWQNSYEIRNRYFNQTNHHIS